MGGLVKKAIMWVVGILVLFQILTGTLPGIITATDNLSNVADLPPIIATIAEFWWVGVLLLLIGVVMSTKAGQGIQRRFSRRRRGRRF